MRGASDGSALDLSATAMMMEVGAGRRAGWAERPARRTWADPEQFTVKSAEEAEAPAGMQAKRREAPDSERMWPNMDWELSLRPSTTPMTAVREFGMKAPGADTLP